MRLFVAGCPTNWTATAITPDYGIDLRVEIARGADVTGEEFYVQVKGRNGVRDPIVNIRQQTINYWLGKLNPTMIVLADTTTGKFWYDWLENCYPHYPHQRDTGESVPLSLAHRSTTKPLVETAEVYLAQYFNRRRADARLLVESGHVSKLLLHVCALIRACSEMAIDLGKTSPLDGDSKRNREYIFFLAFGLHDDFLCSLSEPDSSWKLPLSDSTSTVLLPHLANYMKTRSSFWMREARVSEGDFHFVPTRTSDLLPNLEATLRVLWELQETLTVLLALSQLRSR